MKTQGPILGVSLYSFTNEWQQRLYTLESMVAKVAELGLGPAVEVVGFQSFREYPNISDEFARRFRDLLDKYELVLSSLGGNLDYGLRRDRFLNNDEILDYVERQLVSARKMGFPVLRMVTGISSDIYEQLVPIAEREGVHIGCEVHSPQTTQSPAVISLLELIERLQTPNLGFVPDFGASMTSIAEGQWSGPRAGGVPEELIERTKEIWRTVDAGPERFAAAHAVWDEYGVSPGMAGRLHTVISMNGRMPVEDWAVLLPYTRHCHGKFYHVDESGQEPSIDYQAIMELLKREGYTGTVSAEWEGHAFTEEPIGFREVQAWNAMCSRILAAAEAPTA